MTRALSGFTAPVQTFIEAPLVRHWELSDVLPDFGADLAEPKARPSNRVTGHRSMPLTNRQINARNDSQIMGAAEIEKFNLLVM